MGFGLGIQSQSSKPSDRQRLTTVLSADLCGYSRLAETDETTAIKAVEFSSAIFDEVVRNYRGRVFHRAGDGFMAEFPSVINGVRAAQKLVYEMSSSNSFNQENYQLAMRVGLHVGDVTEQSTGDLLGHGVNIAARLQQEASPNGILISIHAVNLVRGKIDVQFMRRGPLALKNITEPIVAFDVDTSEIRDVLPASRNRHQKFVANGKTVLTVLISAILTIFLVFIVARASFAPPRTNGNEELVADLRGAMAAARFSDNPYSESQLATMRPVLERLAATGNQMELEILSLIERGDFQNAADLLQERIGSLPTSVAHEDVLKLRLVRGELLYDVNKVESILVFQSILDSNPNHFLAQARLGKLYYDQGEWTRSNAHFLRAISIGAANDYERIYTEIDYGVSLVIQTRYQEGIAILDGASDDSASFQFEALRSKAETRIAFAQIKMNDLESARDTINEVLPVQISHSFFRDQAISYAVLGRIYQNEQNYDLAYDYFSKSHELEVLEGREQGVIDTLYHVGMMALLAGRNVEAEKSFRRGLDLARNNNLTHLTIKHYVGMANVFFANGDSERACDELARAEILHTSNTIYNPWTVIDIERLPCNYGPIGRVHSP